MGVNSRPGARSALPAAASTGTSQDGLALLEAMRMGREVRLIVTGTIAGKGFRLGTENEEPSLACAVPVASVEAGELA